MARHLTRERNRSSSFRALMEGTEAMVGDINGTDQKPCRQAARSCATIHSEIKQRIGPGSVQYAALILKQVENRIFKLRALRSPGWTYSELPINLKR